MGRGKNLTESEIALIIKEIAKDKTSKSIDERIIRHVVTVTRFLKNPSRGKPRSDDGDLKSVSKRYMHESIEKKRTYRMPGATSKRIFKESGLPNIAKATRKRILVRMALIKRVIKRPCMTPRHKRLRMGW